jgi:DNA-binding CsgD family transcriptional regulator
MRFRASSARRGRKRSQIGADDVNFLTTSAFDLPDRLAAKADPALIADDEQHFAAIAESLEQSIADLSDRLDTERRAPGGIGQAAMDRDMEIHRLAARLRVLRRFGLDLCLGRMVSGDSAEPVYVGRLGLTDRESEVLGFIAAGWSNQEIGDALFISRKTVSVHASHIFDKLGAGNRSEAAAIAHRLGLDVDAPPPPGSVRRDEAG